MTGSNPFPFMSLMNLSTLLNGSAASCRYCSPTFGLTQCGNVARVGADASGAAGCGAPGCNAAGCGAVGCAAAGAVACGAAGAAGCCATGCCGATGFIRT